MGQQAVDTRSAEAAYATKSNIVPPTTAEGGPRAVGSGTLGKDVGSNRRDFVVHDASAANGVVLLDDTTKQTASTGKLPAGTYDVYAKVRHPSTAAANRSLILQVIDTDGSTVSRILKTFLADGPTGETRAYKVTGVVLVAGDSVQVWTGSDATNAVLSAEVGVVKTD